jgi:hypothetical protein
VDLTKDLSSMVSIDATNGVQMNRLKITSFQLVIVKQEGIVFYVEIPESRSEGSDLALQRSYSCVRGTNTEGGDGFTNLRAVICSAIGSKIRIQLLFESII